MNLRMVYFDDVRALPQSRQFLAFAEAYLDAAYHQCAFIDQAPKEPTYPQGAVVMSLAYHGIELFLKSAILEKSPKELLGGKGGHDLKCLYKRYRELYPEDSYDLIIPFNKEEAVEPASLYAGATSEEIPLIDWMRSQGNIAPGGGDFSTHPDQSHRYPSDGSGVSWQGTIAFIPLTFLGAIAKVQAEIQRLRPLLFPG